MLDLEGIKGRLARRLQGTEARRAGPERADEDIAALVAEVERLRTELAHEDRCFCPCDGCKCCVRS